MKTIFNSTLNTKLVVSLFSLLLLLTNNALANTSISVGPTRGSKAPAITVINNQQQAVNIEQLSGDKGLVILFFRSAGWCPFCKKHLLELNAQAKAFTQLGYGLAAISYDDTDILKAFAEQQHISYPLLSDQKVQTMSAYDIVNNDYAVGDDNYGIPYPGVVVIDERGTVTYKYFFKGYKNRVIFTQLYQQLKSKK